MLPKIIVMSGLPGSGKTTVGKKVAEQIGYEFLSGGNLRGEVASEKGLTIDELNELNEEWTHRIVDDKIKEIGKEGKNILMDSWLAWHFIPHAFKIFIDVDLNISSKRIFEDQRPDEEKKENIEEVKEMLDKRIKTWSNQIKKFYNVDPLDKKNFDLIIDSSDKDIPTIIEQVLKAINS